MSDLPGLLILGLLDGLLDGLLVVRAFFSSVPKFCSHSQVCKHTHTCKRSLTFLLPWPLSLLFADQRLQTIIYVRKYDYSFDGAESGFKPFLVVTVISPCTCRGILGTGST